MESMMRRLWRHAIKNWSASPGRTVAVVLSVALGVATVVITTNLFETARRSITDEVVSHWLGSAHVTVHPVGAHWASMDASLAEALASIENVSHVTARLQRRLRLIRDEDAGRLLSDTWQQVDAIGINPDTERAFRALSNLEGRMFGATERRAAVIERELAAAWHVVLGDPIRLAAFSGGPTLSLTVVGLFDSPRVAAFQRSNLYLPIEDLQELRNEPGVASVIDIILERPSSQALAAAKESVEKVIAERKLPYPYRVETAEARFLVLSEAERVTRLLLMLMAFVALLTSFFIIVTTQGIGLFQRRSQFGIMRCLGLTRSQLTALLLVEVAPLGVIGTVFGILAGVGTSHLVAHASRDVFIHIYISPWGIGFAAVCGTATTLVSMMVVVLQVGHVTPLEAVHSQAKPVRVRTIYAAGVVGIILLLLHHRMTWASDRTRWLEEGYALTGTASLYFGYALLAPAIVILLGRPIARLAGRVLGVRSKLAEEPITRSPWRSSGACWVLMVGLSLIVYTAVRAEGVFAIWDFPGRLPQAFVWSPRYVSGDVIERVRRLPGVAATTVTADVECEMKTAGGNGDSAAQGVIQAWLRKLTRPVFVAGETDKLLRMMKIVFTEGSREDAVEKLKRGGYVLIPPQTARNKKLGVGDKVTVTIAGISAEFEVAAVIESPALDLAVTAFQAESYMQFAAASAILGTRADLIDKFGLDIVSMFMCDIDLPPAPVPPDFDPASLPDFTDDAAIAGSLLRWAKYLPNEADVIARITPVLRTWLDSDRDTPLSENVRRELRRYARATQRLTWSSSTEHQTREENWEGFRSRLVLYRVAQEMDRPNAIIGSLRRLKQQVDLSLRRAMAVITWLPAIMLVIASIGIANLMMVSVHLRARQFAVLRAVGALKSQIIRMVLAEAVTLGLLGSVMGVVLGLHEAHSVNHIAAGLIDVNLEFIVPVGTITLAILLTVGVCVLAGILPACYAARENIIDAMQAP